MHPGNSKLISVSKPQSPSLRGEESRLYWRRGLGTLTFNSVPTEKTRNFSSSPLMTRNEEVGKIILLFRFFETVIRIETVNKTIKFNSSFSKIYDEIDIVEFLYWRLLPV